MELEIYKMTYKIEKNLSLLRILGDDFVKNNKNKGSLIINNKKCTLNSIISIRNNVQNKIQIALSKNIYNKSCMFKNCESLKSLSKSSENDYILDFQIMESNLNDVNEYNKQSIKAEKKLIDSSHTDNDKSSFYPTIENEISDFSEICKIEDKLIDEYEILYFNNIFKKYKKDNYIILKENFSNCKSLTSLPDISEFMLLI